jgi:NADPH:quinone reductase-like Zn-dependent oxidoreductase
MMRAVVLEEFGGALTLTEVDKPAAGPGQVLVRVAASGVNPLDTKITAGTAAHARPVLPAILGLDLAGVVEEAGADVRGFADAGMLRPLVDARRFTPRTVARAHQAVEDGTAASKIVIDIAE